MSLAEVFATAGVIIPLAVVAWSAWQYVMIQRREERRLRFEQFFSLMDRIGGAHGSIASKVAAAYELRKYPEYRELLIRFCRTAAMKVVGDNAKMLSDELTHTADFFEAGRLNG